MSICDGLQVTNRSHRRTNGRPRVSPRTRYTLHCITVVVNPAMDQKFDLLVTDLGSEFGLLRHKHQSISHSISLPNPPETTVDKIFHDYQCFGCIVYNAVHLVC
jgi:hypothetical protein